MGVGVNRKTGLPEGGGSRSNVRLAGGDRESDPPRTLTVHSCASHGEGGATAGKTCRPKSIRLRRTWETNYKRHALVVQEGRWRFEGAASKHRLRIGRSIRCVASRGPRELSANPSPGS